MTFKETRKGFTLIELLVVVAVLALLASIVFSNLGGAREGARISNALQFQSQMHNLLGSDLVGWWNFNEGSGTTARDISGYGNNGTIVGATHVDGVPGTGGSALSFDGVGDYVQVENAADLDIVNSITVSVWVTNEITGTERIITTKGWYHASYGSARSWWLLRDSDNRFKFGVITDNHEASFPNTIPASEDTWYHVVGTYDGEIIRIFVNSKEGNPYSKTGGMPLGAPIRIGNGLYQSNNAYHFNGLIDDVRIYSRALTASEIQTLYAQTKDRYLANE